MPELPEAETIRRELEADVVGERIASVAVLRNDVVCGDADDFVAAIMGKMVTGTGRRGKALWLCLQGNVGIGVHLRMSGRLLLDSAQKETPPHTHVLLETASGLRLLYVDPRRFGRVELLNLGRLGESILLRNIGPDALSEDLSVEELRRAASHHGIGIKEFLLCQEHLSGIGNIYASEILHRGRLHPATPANRVTAEEMGRLLAATREVLIAAIAAKGTTLADASYQTALCASGGYQHRLSVYGREGENCRVAGCRGVVKRVKAAGRSTYFCPVCQAKSRRQRGRAS